MASDEITLVIKSMVGNTYRCTVPENATVRELQNCLEQESEISVDRQKLVSMRRQPLDPSKTLQDYKLKDKSKLFVIVLSNNIQEILSEKILCRKLYQDGWETWQYWYMWVDFDENGAPLAYRRHYCQEDGTENAWQYTHDWNTEVISITRGLHEDPTEEVLKLPNFDIDNTISVLVWHPEFQKQVKFSAFHADKTKVEQWTTCFQGLANATHIWEEDKAQLNPYA